MGVDWIAVGAENFQIIFFKIIKKLTLRKENFIRSADEPFDDRLTIKFDQPSSWFLAEQKDSVESAETETCVLQIGNPSAIWKFARIPKSKWNSFFSPPPQFSLILF